MSEESGCSLSRRLARSHVVSNKSTPAHAPDPGTSPYSRWRVACLCSVYLFMGLHFAHWWVSGETLAPLEVSEVQYTLHLGIVTAGFLFMAAAVVGTVLFGRFFCGWGCHLLALEDLSAWLLRKLGLRPGRIRSRALAWIPVLAVADIFLWPQVHRVLRGAPPPSLHIVSDAGTWGSFLTDDMWRNLPEPEVAVLTFAVCGFAIVYLLGSRSFCAYVCPYGLVFRIADRAAVGRIVLAGDCSGCGICVANCDAKVDVRAEVARFGTVVDSNCLKDLDCVGLCPEDALQYGFTRPPVLLGWKALQAHRRPYDLTSAEEVAVAGLAVGFMLVTRGLYDAMPFLLTLASSAIFAILCVFAVRVVRRPSVRLQSTLLKGRGRLRASGWALLIATVALGALVVHSAFIRYHTVLGQWSFERLARQHQLTTVDRAPDSPVMTEARMALAHFDIASRWGLLEPTSLHRRKASLYELTGQPTRAIPQLERVVADVPDDAEARLRLARLLSDRGQIAEAQSLLRWFLQDEPEHADERVRTAEANALLAHLAVEEGDREEAIRLLDRATSLDPTNAKAAARLGALLVWAGRYLDADPHLTRSAALRPDSVSVLQNLGVVRMLLGDETGALRILGDAARLDPGHAPTHYHLGILHQQRREFTKSQAALSRSLALHSDSAEAHYRMFQVLVELGEPEQAERHRERAGVLEPRFR